MDIDFAICYLLFRKISKGFNVKDYNFVQTQLRIKKLETKLKKFAPRKKRKIKSNSNSKFIGIKTIRNVQIEIGDREIDINDLSNILVSDSTGSFIEIE